MPLCDPRPHSLRLPLTCITPPGSFAGHSLANTLGAKLPPTHRILLIEQNDFTAHLPGVVRGLVEPGWEERNLTAPTRQETVFKAGVRHRVLSPVRVLKLLEGRVLLDTEFEGSTEVPFDVSCELGRD
jgi:hypothetical protein